MGIRPEHIHDEELYLKNYPQYKFTATVDNSRASRCTRPTCSCCLGGQAVHRPRSILPPPRRWATRSKITFEADRVHLFDPDTEKCIDL